MGTEYPHAFGQVWVHGGEDVHELFLQYTRDSADAIHAYDALGSYAVPLCGLYEGYGCGRKLTCPDTAFLIAVDLEDGMRVPEEDVKSAITKFDLMPSIFCQKCVAGQTAEHHIQEEQMPMVCSRCNRYIALFKQGRNHPRCTHLASEECTCPVAQAIPHGGHEVEWSPTVDDVPYSEYDELLCPTCADGERQPKRVRKADEERQPERVRKADEERQPKRVRFVDAPSSPFSEASTCSPPQTP
jgi:hypothetical protein